MTTTEPPAKGFETKSNQPGYQLGGQPAAEHGPDGIQPGYSNSEGPDGDDGTSVFDAPEESAKGGAKRSSSSSTAAKTSDSK